MGGRIVGREHELEAIDAFLDRLAVGPAALLLDGEAGIGKTTLWAEAIEQARRDGVRVLACRTAESEVSLAFVALDDLLEPVLDEVLPAIAGPQRQALAAALALVEPTETFGRHAVARATLSALRILADHDRVVVAVDDVQWLDRATAEVLEFAGRRVGDRQVGFLLSRRGAGQAVPLGLKGVSTVTVGPLSVNDLDRMLRTSLSLGLARPSLVELHRISGGNPFYALEIARAYRGDGAFAMPTTLTELLRARVEALSGVARDAIVLAAAAEPATARELERAAGSSVGMEEALAADMLSFEGERVRFRHPLLAAVAYDSAPPWTRREAHRRLAAVAREGEERARHLALATDEPDEAVAAELETAALLAATKGAPAAAAVLTGHAARLTPPEEEAARRRRLLLDADLSTAAGDPGRGRRILEGLIAELPAGHERANLLCRLADAVGDDLGESIRLCTQAAAEAGDDPVLGAQIETSLGVFTWIAGDLVASTNHIQAAAELAERSGDELLVAISLGELCHAQTVLGLPYRSEDMERALELEEKLGSFPAYMRPSFQLGVIHMYRDEPDAARPLLQAELRRIETEGDEGVRIGVLFRLADLELRAGNWAEAARAAHTCMSLALQAATEQEQSVGLTVHGLVQAHLGNLEEANRSAEEGLDLANRAGDRIIALRARAVLGFNALSVGDHVEAADWLTPAREELERLGTGELSISVVVQNEIETLVALGRYDEALGTIAFVEEKGRPTRRPWHEAMAARGRALVAAARGDVDGARKQLDTALRAHERLPQPFELGRTLLAQGQIERRAKRRAVARTALTQALEIFDSLGAPLWAEKTAAELARLPGRPRGTGQLTETEQRVAEMVAAGLTNKEVAARLFVTVRTVEANLSKVYAKLGIRSRTELASRLGGGAHV